MIWMHTCTDGARPLVARARAPVCPSLATPLRGREDSDRGCQRQTGAKGAGMEFSGVADMSAVLKPQMEVRPVQC